MVYSVITALWFRPNKGQKSYQPFCWGQDERNLTILIVSVSVNTVFFQLLERQNQHSIALEITFEKLTCII